jgi:hypothetical protein
MSDWSFKAAGCRFRKREVCGGQEKSREFVKSRSYRSQRENGDHGDDDDA